jgi:hypothetical protein
VGERRADFGENLNWDLVVRDVYQNPMMTVEGGVVAGVIAPVSFDLSSPYLVIGCESQSARQTWFLGCRAKIRIKVRVSSTSPFTQGLEVFSKPCGLFRQTLIQVPPIVQPRPYSLVLEFPYWMPSINVEIWQYSLTGLDENIELAAVERVEEALMDIAFGTNQTLDLTVEPP